MVQEEKLKIVPVYLRSGDHTWIPALQLKTHDGKAVVSVPKFVSGEKDMLQCHKQSKQFPYQANNQLIDLKEYPNSLLPMQNVDSNGNLEDYGDMVDLPFMHEVRHCTESLFIYQTLIILNLFMIIICFNHSYNELFFVGCDFVQLEIASHA